MQLSGPTIARLLAYSFKYTPEDVSFMGPDPRTLAEKEEILLKHPL